MSKKKFKWTDTEDIAFLLIDKYPSTDPTRLSLQDIAKRAAALPDFGGGAAKPDPKLLESIQKSWFEERSDMEDELGPLSADHDTDDDDLNEDEYRDDRMIDEEVSVIGSKDGEDEEEDEFGDGFHEDELADEK